MPNSHHRLRAFPRAPASGKPGAGWLATALTRLVSACAVQASVPLAHSASPMEKVCRGGAGTSAKDLTARPCTLQTPVRPPAYCSVS